MVRSFARRCFGHLCLGGYPSPGTAHHAAHRTAWTQEHVGGPYCLPEWFHVVRDAGGLTARPSRRPVMLPRVALLVLVVPPTGIGYTEHRQLHRYTPPNEMMTDEQRAENGVNCSRMCLHCYFGGTRVPSPNTAKMATFVTRVTQNLCFYSPKRASSFSSVNQSKGPRASQSKEPRSIQPKGQRASHSKGARASQPRGLRASRSTEAEGRPIKRYHIILWRPPSGAGLLEQFRMSPESARNA